MCIYFVCFCTKCVTYENFIASLLVVPSQMNSLNACSEQSFSYTPSCIVEIFGISSSSIVVVVVVVVMCKICITSQMIIAPRSFNLENYWQTNCLLFLFWTHSNRKLLKQIQNASTSFIKWISFLIIYIILKRCTRGFCCNPRTNEYHYAYVDSIWIMYMFTFILSNIRTN